MSEKILLIDDSENIRRLMGLFLRQKGYDVREVSDGYQGLEEASKYQPDLILLDIVMPGLDGYAVCEKLKKDEKTKEIPVVFLSSLTEAKDRIKGLESGGIDYISKKSDQTELLARVSTHLRLRALTKELIERNNELLQNQARIEEDLRAAATIQRSLLPKKIPPLGNLRIAWKSLPCELVGGDIFNIIPITENQLAFYMLDVSGHGVPSAMVTVSVSQYFQEFLNFHTKAEMLSPKKMLERLDKDYPLERFDRLFTLFYMVIDIHTGKVLHSTAGHPPPVLLHPDKGMEFLDKGGAIIGVNEDIPFEQGEKQLQVGDKLLLYTDGVIEFENKQGQFYGKDRFYELLERKKYEPIERLLDFILQDLDAFGNHIPPQDDISLMGIEYK